MVSNTDLAWAAGFFDGEGTSSCLKAERDKYRYIRMSISQKKRECLDRFVGIVGVGKIYKSNKRDIHSWDLYHRDDVLFVVKQLWPYLSEIKKEQFRQAVSKVNESTKNPISLEEIESV